jgi:DNA mismatch repair protein MutH
MLYKVCFGGSMEREEAIKKFEKLVGKDLRRLAEIYDVTVFKGGKKNKGWAGHVLERYLGLPLNASQAPNYGTWELKVASLKYLKNGSLTVKETMAITMINPLDLEKTEFEESHLLKKLRKCVIAARIWINKEETSSVLHSVNTFDLTDVEIYNQVKEDYNLVRDTIIYQGFEKLTGKMGVYIQPRTKGPGHGSTSRAFYARTGFLKEIILKR